MYPAMKAYVNSVALTDGEFIDLLNNYKKSTTWVRYSIFRGIYNQDKQDKSLDFIFAEILQLVSIEYHENDGSRLSNEYTELKECLKRLKERNSILKLLEFIKTNYGSISGSIYFRDIIDDVLVRSGKDYPKDNQVFELIVSIFTDEEIRISNEAMDHFLNYFKGTDNVYSAFVEIYKRLDISSVFDLGLLVKLANEESIEFFANEFRKGNVQRFVVENFQYLLGQDHALLKEFNLKINEIELIHLPTTKDFESERKELNKKTRNLLFDKGHFLAAVDKVFVDIGKNELSFDELWDAYDIQPNGTGNFPEIVYDTIRSREINGKSVRENLAMSLERNWDSFWAGKIVAYLKKNPASDFTDEQLAQIKQWCDHHAKTIDFTTAISFPDADRTTVKRVANKLSYLIRKLSLKHYPKQLYLDFLSFPKWDDNEMDIFDFVESILDTDDITERVLVNLTAGIKYHVVLESHLDYCVKHRLNQSTPSLVQYLNNRDYPRKKVLDSYMLLNGSLGPIEKLLPSLDDYFMYEVFQELINRKSLFIYSYLTNLFSSEKNKEAKLKIAEFLIQLQSLKAVQFYVKYIKQSKSVPGDSSPSNPLFKLTNIFASYYVFVLYEMSTDSSISQGPFSRLSDLSIGALQSICLVGSNFKWVKRIFRIYAAFFLIGRSLGIKKTPIKVIRELRHYFENIEQQYYVNKSVNVDLKEALRIYSSI
ncbi:MAG: hypothetical protein HOP08_08500 [Cyclobacteriaceae bacterium]|nr:hypothetical protein [Cyclobacteriaceae bacterium]